MKVFTRLSYKALLVEVLYTPKVIPTTSIGSGLWSGVSTGINIQTLSRNTHMIKEVMQRYPCWVFLLLKIIIHLLGNNTQTTITVRHTTTQNYKHSFSTQAKTRSWTVCIRVDRCLQRIHLSNIFKFKKMMC